MSTQAARRIILINKKFQLSLAGAFVLLQVLLTGLFGVGLYLFLNSELQAGLASAHASYRNLKDMLLPIVLVLGAFSLALSTGMVLAFVVLLSHRIAGPLFRFRTVLEDLANRKLATHPHLRPGDQLLEVSTSLGKALETIATDLSALTAVAAELQQASAPLDNPDLAAAVARLQQVVARWR